MIEFRPWVKIPRLNRDITITEKIDGTNGAIGIVDMSAPDVHETYYENVRYLRLDAGIGWPYAVYAQSRSRIITPKQDNHGFAQWVWDNAEDLVTTLGPGLHFGEWWGHGIQGRYNDVLPKGEHRFSLFNTKRWFEPDVESVPNLHVVPVLYEGAFCPASVLPPWVKILHELRERGSVAAPGCTRPEGIVIYHHAANMMFKVTLENDEVPKAVIEKRREKVKQEILKLYDLPRDLFELAA